MGERIRDRRGRADQTSSRKAGDQVELSWLSESTNERTNEEGVSEWRVDLDSQKDQARLLGLSIGSFWGLSEPISTV